MAGCGSESRDRLVDLDQGVGADRWTRRRDSGSSSLAGCRGKGRGFNVGNTAGEKDAQSPTWEGLTKCREGTNLLSQKV